MTGTAIYDFSEETVIVTGSTKGIGRGVAEAFADADANVVVNSRTDSDVIEAAEALSERGTGDVIGVPGDVSDPADIETLIEETIEAFDGVDVLVNNAAMWPMEESMLELSLDEWQQAFAVNVQSQFYAARLVAEHWIEHDRTGAIVNTTSQTGDRRTGGRGLYGVTKTAINGLTWRFAHDLAQHGIRLNAISTGATESDQLRYEASLEAEDDPERTTADVLAELGAEKPIGRLGQPADVADGVLFLASDRAEYVVGHVLRVSGGANLQ